MHENVAQYEDLENVIKLASYNEKIRAKQAHNKKLIEDMRLVFTSLNQKIQRVIKEQNMPIPKPEKVKPIDSSKDKK
jgi:hypothetical protein